MMKLLLFFFAVIFFLIGAGLLNDYLRERFKITSTPASRKLSPEQLAEICLNEYPYIAIPVTQCVNENAETCGLMQSKTAEQHFAPISYQVRTSEKYPVIFCFDFDRVPDRCDIHHLNSPRKFTTVPLSQMIRVLNRSLESHCIAHGCPPLIIVAGKDIGDGRVRFALVHKYQQS